MIGRLKGNVVERGLDGSLVLDVAGVGYEVFVPRGGQINDDLTLYVHTHVASEALALYGFMTLDDRAAFRALLGVSKIGPKLALAIMSAVTASELANALARGDRAALSKIPGVGKKTVERIFLDLKDKLIVGPGMRPVAGPRKPKSAAPTGALATAVGALVQMGYKRPEAERAVDGLDHDRSVEEILREALAALA